MNMLDVKYSVFDEKMGKIIDVPPLDEALEAIKHRMIRLQRRNEELAEKNAELQSGAWASKEMQKTLQEAKRIRSEYQLGFPMTKEEVDLATEWINNHNKLHENESSGTIGGRYTYEFTPTSIGVFASVRCTCGAFCNLTDYSNI